jgi:bacterioferritin-associated ferredoxin
VDEEPFGEILRRREAVGNLQGDAMTAAQEMEALAKEIASKLPCGIGWGECLALADFILQRDQRVREMALEEAAMLAEERDRTACLDCCCYSNMADIIRSMKGET